MAERKPLQKTAGGLAAVHEIPDLFFQDRIISFLRTKNGGASKINTLADDVYNYGQFKHRGKNKDELYSRIWDNVDKLIEQGVLVQYSTKTMVKIKLAKQ